MQNTQGFLLVNIYAFLVIFATSIIFFSKKRMKQIEDELYKKFLVSNILISISGLLLGFIVSSKIAFDNLLIGMFNKIYLISLSSWIAILTFYIVYVSKENKINIEKFKKINNIIITICALLIILLPIKVTINTDGSALALGPSVIFTYTMFGIGFLTQIFCVFSNYKNLNNKKYIPLYLLIFLGSILLIILIADPSLNYIINPTFILIAFVMYFTIENPDMKILEEVHNAKVISDNANEEKTMFLYNMTSSLREITKDINYEADYIIDESSTKKPDLITINDSAREIKVSTGKFTTMTNEMLDVSHLDAASIKVYNDKYNIKLILKEIITIYKDKIKNKNLDFRTNIQSDLPEYLYGDALNLKNVLTSLLDNSLKYTNKGYIELSVNYIKKNDIARLIISIEDSGIGIKSTELEKIFNKNKEELNKYNLKNNLYTARKLVTLMGGTIIASSTFGVGTIMKVVLDQKIDTDTFNNYDKVLDKKKILLVEDSSVTTKLITKYLKDSNVIIDIVELGSDALDKIRNHEKYDLILLEEDLKPLDAYTIIKKLNQIKNFNIKVVLLTKNTSLEYTDTYKDQGFTNVLIKPIDKEKLINIINI